MEHPIKIDDLGGGNTLIVDVMKYHESLSEKSDGLGSTEGPRGLKNTGPKWEVEKTHWYNVPKKWVEITR